jgi:ABC-type lipoprotein release transport system permease subunit
VAQAVAEKGFGLKSEAVATRLDRRLLDTLISWTGAVMALALIALGAAAIFGGSFAMSNVRDRLAPENITFAPASAMSPEEIASVGAFAGQKVTTGPQAEAFSRYIGGHLAAVNEGATYSETSAAARTEGISAKQAADLSAKADTLFKGETLRSILLNAYGWWTVGQITLWAGFAAVALGLVLAVLAAFGFRHSRKVQH